MQKTETSLMYRIGKYQTPGYNSWTLLLHPEPQKVLPLNYDPDEWAAYVTTFDDHYVANGSRGPQTMVISRQGLHYGGITGELFFIDDERPELATQSEENDKKCIEKRNLDRIKLETSFMLEKKRVLEMNIESILLEGEKTIPNRKELLKVKNILHLFKCILLYN